VITRYGSPCRRLIKVNGEPLSKQDDRREQQKFEKAIGYCGGTPSERERSPEPDRDGCCLDAASDLVSNR
jgi:hypothetical protein